jgi:hypothetical protein
MTFAGPTMVTVSVRAKDVTGLNSLFSEYKAVIENTSAARAVVWNVDAAIPSHLNEILSIVGEASAVVSKTVAKVRFVPMRSLLV